MTASIEPEMEQDEPAGPLDAGWRAEREVIQEQLMPSGQAVVSCPAPFGSGGLGRHLKEIADAFDRHGEPAICLCAEPSRSGTASSSPLHHEVRTRSRPSPLNQLARFSPALRNLRRSVAFDRAAAAQLPAAKHLLAFNGQALQQFQAARQAKYESTSLVAANPHLRVLLRKHEQAHRQYPLEGSWATRLLERNLEEYGRAERIYVASRYTWESFVEEGVPERRLALFPLIPDSRFTPRETPADSGTFDVVFVGRLCVTKGVPLLVDAVRALSHRDLRLHLVGGWSSRGMRRFLQQACSRDPRIRIGPGDPLPRLREAGIFAHPAYEDGFAYAPAEALACGVPVLVSEDTGMKDLIDPGVTGMILPTGDLRALTEAIDSAYRGEIFNR
jgi:glycosyltransferase involved in cell wall biosynthesis